MTKILGVYVRRASRDAIVSGFKKISQSYLSRDRLIAKGNRLVPDGAKAIKNHLGNSPRYVNYKLRNKEVQTFLSASTLSHLLDSWNYLSRSIDAFLKGDQSIAIHLAYYAELRAAMSYLAGEGIGVMSRRHIAIDQNENFHITNNKLSSPTHIFVWKSLKNLAERPDRPNHNILKTLSVNGYDFDQLCSGFHSLATPGRIKLIAKEWLLEWTFDISKYEDDREIRNIVSYRPQTLDESGSTFDAKQSFRSIHSLLRAISPSSTDKFNLLDIYLLRSLFRKISEDLSLTDLEYEESIVNAFTHQGASLGLSLLNLLLGKAPFDTEHILFDEARKKDISALPMICRVILLLRITTGSVSQLLKDANIDLERLNFIWHSYALKNGFWEIQKPVSSFNDLWTELEMEYSELIENLDELEGNSSYSLRKELAEDVNLLSQFNRAALWGI